MTAVLYVVNVNMRMILQGNGLEVESDENGSSESIERVELSSITVANLGKSIHALTCRNSVKMSSRGRFYRPVILMTRSYISLAPRGHTGDSATNFRPEVESSTPQGHLDDRVRRVIATA